MNSNQVDVGSDDPQLVLDSRVREKFALLINAGPDTTYLGEDDVTPTTGFPLAAGASVMVGNMMLVRDRLWAICDTAEAATIGLLIRSL